MQTRVVNISITRVLYVAIIGLIISNIAILALVYGIVRNLVGSIGNGSYAAHIVQARTPLQ